VRGRWDGYASCGVSVPLAFPHLPPILSLAGTRQFLRRDPPMVPESAIREFLARVRDAEY